jgi:hypothetical protein
MHPIWWITWVVFVHARNQDCCVTGSVTTVYLMAFAEWELHCNSVNGNCQFLKLLGTNAVSKIWSATLSKENKNDDLWGQLFNYSLFYHNFLLYWIILLKQRNIVRYIKAQRLAWLGHWERMHEERTTNKVTCWKPLSSRSKGWSEKKWEDHVL